jgi:putative Ca2+/H+ antiporter (TMEM165/GDT1 family)
MLLIYKNKGLLVILYLIVAAFGCALLAGILKRNFGGVFSEINFSGTVGTAFIIAAVWTYLTKDDYYKDNNGEKKKLDIPNELFFIRMEIWSYIFVVAGLVFIGNSFLKYCGWN